MVVSARNPVHSVLFLILCFFNAAGLFVLIGASPSLILEPVSLGVILGLCLGKPIGVAGTSLLLVRLGVASLPTGVTPRHVIGAGMVAGIGFTMSLFVAGLGFEAGSMFHTEAKVGILVASIGHVVWGAPAGLAEVNSQTGNVTGVAQLIFGRYVWVFEITSALLITAALGAMVLAHRERLGKGPNQKEWSRRRFREGEHLAGLPAPGVYARHNAVDTPALLPDGTPSELSVSRVLTAREQVTTPTRHVDSEHAIEHEIEEGRER